MKGRSRVTMSNYSNYVYFIFELQSARSCFVFLSSLRTNLLSDFLSADPRDKFSFPTFGSSITDINKWGDDSTLHVATFVYLRTLLPSSDGTNEDLSLGSTKRKSD